MSLKDKYLTAQKLYQNKVSEISPEYTDQATELVDSLYSTQDRLMQNQKALNTFRQMQIANERNPYDNPDLTRFLPENIGKRTSATQMLQGLRSSIDIANKRDEFETNRQARLLGQQIASDQFAIQEQAQMEQRKKLIEALALDLNVNDMSEAYLGFNQDLLGNDDPYNYEMKNVIKSNALEFVGNLAKGSGALVGDLAKGAGDVLETFGRQVQRKLTDDGTRGYADTPEALKGFWNNLKEDWNKSRENDSILNPGNAIAEAGDWVGNRILKNKEEMRARSLNNLDSFMDSWNKKGFSLDLVDILGGMAAESVVHPETAMVIATGPLGLAGKALGAMAVATAKGSEMAVNQREAEARLKGLSTEDLYRAKLTLGELTKQLPAALAYTGLNYLEVEAAMRMFKGRIIPKNLVNADLKEVARYATRSLPKEQMESIAKNGFKSAVENAWSFNRLAPHLRKGIERTIDGDNALKELFKMGSKKLAQGTAIGLGKAVGRGALAGAAEAPIEYLQTRLELTARPDLTDEQKHKEAMEAAKAGFVVGGTIGGASSFVGNSTATGKDIFTRGMEIKSERDKAVNSPLTNADIQSMKSMASEQPTQTNETAQEHEAMLDQFTRDIENYAKRTEPVSGEDEAHIIKAIGILAHDGRKIKNLSPETQRLIKDASAKAANYLEEHGNDKDGFAGYISTLSPLERTVARYQFRAPEVIEKFLKGDRLNSPDSDYGKVLDENYNKFTTLVEGFASSPNGYTQTEANALKLLAKNIKEDLKQGSKDGFSRVKSEAYIYGTSPEKGSKPSLTSYLAGLLSPRASKEQLTNIKNSISAFRISHRNKQRALQVAKQYVFKDNDSPIISFAVPKYNANDPIKVHQGQLSKTSEDYKDFHIIHKHRSLAKNAKFFKNMGIEIANELETIKAIEALADERLGNPKPTQETKVEPVTQTKPEPKIEATTAPKAEKPNPTPKPVTKPKEEPLDREQDTKTESKVEKDDEPKIQVEPNPVDTEQSSDTAKDEQINHIPDIIIHNNVNKAKKAAKDKEGLYTLNVNDDMPSGIDTIPTLDKGHHFGSPFVSTSVAGTRGEGTDAEVSQMYYDWITTDKYLDREPERREWIREQITNGALDNVPLIYYADTPVNPAKMLAKIIANRTSLGLFVPLDTSVLATIKDLETELANDKVINLNEVLETDHKADNLLVTEPQKAIEAVKEFIGASTFNTLSNKLRRIIPLTDDKGNITKYRKDGEVERIANASTLLEDERTRSAIIYRAIEWVLSSPMNIRQDTQELIDKLQKLYGNEEGYTFSYDVLLKLYKTEFESSALGNIGSKILRDIGIKPNKKNISYEQMSLIEQELGLYAVRLMVEEGLVKQESIPRQMLFPNIDESEANTQINVYKLGNKSLKEGLLKQGKDYNIFDKFNELGKTLKDEEAEVATYETTKPDEKFAKKTFIKGKGKVAISKLHREAMNVMERTGYKVIDKPMLLDLLSNEEFLNSLKTAMGYRPITNNENNTNYYDEGYVLPSLIDSVEGKNKEVETSIQTLKEFLSSPESDNPVYFKVFMSKNDRFFFDSTTLNPQANKFHRFLLSPESTLQTYQIENNEVPNEVFYQAIAQAFGFATDKKSTNEAIAFGKKVVERFLDKDPKEYFTFLKNFLDNPGKYTILDNKITLEEPSHAIQAVIAISKMKEAIDNSKDTFEAVLTTEADAINNGLVLKSMQHMLDSSTIDNLSAGGVVFGNDSAKRINDRYDEGENDLYKLFAKEIGNITSNLQINDEITSESLKVLGIKGYSTSFEQSLLQFGKELVQEIASAFALDKDGNVTSKGRKLAKPTSTVFGYGAGDKSSVLNLVNAFTEDIPNKVFAYLYKNDKTAKKEYDLVFNMVKLILEAENKKPTEQGINALIKSALMSDNGLFSLPITITAYTKQGKPYPKKTYLGGVITASYYGILHKSLISSLDKMYKHMKTTNSLFNRAVNESLLVRNALFQKYKQAKLANLKRKELTIAEEEEIQSNLDNILPLPSFQYNPDSPVKSEIYKTEKISNPAYKETIGITRLKAEMANSKFKWVSKTLTGKSKVFAEVGASPNVLVTHQADGNNMGTTVRDNKDKGIIPVHDATVTDANNALKVNQDFNRVSYEDSMKRDTLGQALDIAYNTAEVVSKYKVEAKNKFNIAVNPDETLNDMRVIHEVSEFNRILARNASITYDNIQNGFNGSEYTATKDITSAKELKNMMASLYEYDKDGEKNLSHNVLSVIDNAISFFENKSNTAVVKELKTMKSTLEFTYKDQELQEQDLKEEPQTQEDTDIETITETLTPANSNAENTEQVKELVAGYVKEVTQSKKLNSPDNVSKDIAEDTVLVEQFNGDVSQIYKAQETMRDMDLLDGTYDKEHSEHLQDVIKTMLDKNAKALQDVTVTLSKTNKETNEGTFIPYSKKVKIASGSNVSKAKLSKEETFAHEMIHAMTSFGLDVLGLSSREGQQLLTIHKQAIENITIEDLMPEVSTGNVDEDIAIAKKLYNHFKRNDVEGIKEFMAMGLTNKNLVAKLKSIKYKHREQTKQNMNMFERMVEGVKDLLASAFDIAFKGARKNQNLYDALMAVNLKIANANNKARASEAKKISLVGALVQASLEKGNKAIIDWFSDLKEEMKEAGYKHFVFAPEPKENASFIKRASWILGNYAVALLDKKQMAIFRKYLSKLPMAKYGGAVQSLIDDFSKADNYGRALEDLIAISNRIDGDKLAIKATHIKALEKGFSKPLDKETKQKLGMAVLDTDLVSLLDTYSIDEVKELLNNPEDIKKEKAKITSTISKLISKDSSFKHVPKEKYMNFIENQTNGLAYYMNKNKVYLNGQLLNAENIANMYGSKYVRQGASAELVKNIDMLTTLKALKMMSPELNKALIDTISNERTGIEQVFNAIRNYKTEADNTIFKTSPYNKIKGYRPEKLDDSRNIIIARLEDSERLAIDGYKPLSNTPMIKNSVDSFSAKRIFYVNEFMTQEPTWNKAAVKLTSLQSKGHTLADLYQDDLVKGKNVSKEEYINTIKAVEKKHRGQSNSMFDKVYPVKDASEVILLPIVDSTGHFQQFRYFMNKADKLNLLGMDTDIFDSIGTMYSTKFDKIATMEHNKRVASTLYQNWKAYQELSKSEKKLVSGFVELSKYSRDMDMRDIYRILPESFLETLKEKFGKDPIMIQADLAHWVFGFRDIDITKISDKYIHNSDFRRAIKIGDTIVRKATKLAKEEVVVKSTKTITSNIISNFNQCIMQGCSPADVWKDQIEGINALVAYRDNIYELKTMEAQRKGGVKINETAYENLKRSLKNSPVKEMIEWGMFTSIVEDLDMVDKKDDIDRKLDEVMEKLPKPIKIGLDMAFITKDTTMYQTLAKILQYSDFVARYSLMKGLKRQGITDPEIIKNKLRDSFINYDLPMSPSRKALEDRGFVLFSKFFTRIQKVIANDILGEKPIQGLMTMLFNSRAGLNLETPFDSSFIDKNYDVLFSNPIEMVANAVTPASLNYIPK